MQLGHNCALRSHVLAQAAIPFHTQAPPHTYFPISQPPKQGAAEARRESVFKRATEGQQAGMGGGGGHTAAPSLHPCQRSMQKTISNAY